MTLQQSKEYQEQRHNQPTTENYLGSGGVVILPDDNLNPSVPVAESNITKNNDEKIVTNSVLRTLPAEDYATMTIVPISSSLFNGGLTTANDLNVNGPYSEFQSWDSGNLVYGYIYGISGLTLTPVLTIFKTA